MRFSTLAIAIALTACNPATETDDPVDTSNPVASDDTIIGVATDNGSFTTLLAAVDAAGLTETLQGDGPFTVFAPTDDAFDALPAGTVDALLQDIPALTDILLYHVLDAEVPSSAVGDYSLVTTLNGVDFKVSTDGGVFINDAEVVIVDVEASNGVIHVIDSVLIPPATIGEIAAGSEDFTILTAALEAADLKTTLEGDGPFTVFAPTDAAFAKLPAGTVDSLLNDIPTLTSILLYHVNGSRLPAADVVGSTSVATLAGIDANVDAGALTIGGAAIVGTDIPARNGVIHVLDDVMLPPAPEQ